MGVPFEDEAAREREDEGCAVADDDASTVIPASCLAAVCDRERVRGAGGPFLIEEVREVAFAGMLSAGHPAMLLLVLFDARLHKATTTARQQ